jgi:translation initiation factor IF-2
MAVVVWMQPRGDQRIAEIERRLDEQRQKEELAKKEEQARKDEERQQIAEESERKRRDEARKTEPPVVAAAAPVSPVKKPETMPAQARRDVTPRAQPVVRPAPQAVSKAPQAPAPVVAAPVVEIAPAPRPSTPAAAPDVVALVPPMVQPAPAAAKPPEAPIAVPSDPAAAVAHYRKLAQQGNADAALKLGELYEAGRGVVQNNNWAYSWYAVAERRGLGAAKSRKEAVASKLQPRERQQAERFADGQTGQTK